jgi:hypothetical protein
MSNVGLQERIRGLAMYRDGDRMRPGCVASRLSTTGKVIRTQTARAALKEMAANGEIKADGNGAFYKPLPAREWLIKVWRKRTSRALGLDAYPEILRAAL